MKIFKLVSLVLTVSFMISVTNVRAESEIENCTSTYSISDDVVGAFEYHVPGVDPMYQNGIMHITKEEDAYAVNIHLGESVIPTEDVEVNGKEVKFALYVEGERVEVVVVVDGDKITGSGLTNEGPFTLSGTRKADPE